MKIIGLSGRMRVGKTTLADLIVAQVPGAVRRSYADALRDVVCDLYGFRPQLVRQSVFKSMHFRLGAKEMTGREVLQQTGCFVREVAPGYWVEAMRRFLMSCEAPLVAVDDLRFRDEVDLIRELGGIVLRLEPYDTWEPGENSDHISETALDDYPFALRYRPAFGELGQMADALVKELVDEVAA